MDDEVSAAHSYKGKGGKISFCQYTNLCESMLGTARNKANYLALHWEVELSINTMLIVFQVDWTRTLGQSQMQHWLSLNLLCQKFWRKPLIGLESASKLVGNQWSKLKHCMEFSWPYTSTHLWETGPCNTISFSSRKPQSNQPNGETSTGNNPPADQLQ
jgi:hypothetical protein